MCPVICYKDSYKYSINQWQWYYISWSDNDIDNDITSPGLTMILTMILHLLVWQWYWQWYHISWFDNDIDNDITSPGLTMILHLLVWQWYWQRYHFSWFDNDIDNDITSPGLTIMISHLLVWQWYHFSWFDNNITSPGLTMISHLLVWQWYWQWYHISWFDNDITSPGLTMILLLLVWQCCYFSWFENNISFPGYFQICIVLGVLILVGLLLLITGRSQRYSSEPSRNCTCSKNASTTSKLPRIIHQTSKLPRIIHQTWSSYSVPRSFITWIHSWLKHNPDWEYWFWTDEEIDTLLALKYPELRSVFRDEYQGIQRGDAIRYLAMYEFGGVYADLDMECRKPLDYLASGYDCFLSEENYEHVTLLYHRKEPIIINCIMGCRPKHPFYKRVIEGLPRSKMTDVLTSTGPFFFTDVYDKFRQEPDLEIHDHIVTLPPRYLLPMSDLKNPDIKRICKENKTTMNPDIIKYVTNPSVNNNQTAREQELCQKLVNARFKIEMYPESLTVHHWIHSWLVEIYDFKPTRIEKLVPNVKFIGRLQNGTQTSKYYKPVWRWHRKI